MRQVVHRPRRQYKYHKVRRGQTLSSIARRYRRTVTQIKKWNGLKSSRIFVGQKLNLRNSPKVTKRVQKRRKFHSVRRGQNLTSIARRYGLRVSKLKSWNGLKSSKIQPGQKIWLSKNIDSDKPSYRNKPVHYRIQPGDSLAKIARRFQTSIAKLKALNKLTSNRILKGQRLLITTK